MVSCAGAKLNKIPEEWLYQTGESITFNNECKLEFEHKSLVGYFYTFNLCYFNDDTNCIIQSIHSSNTTFNHNLIAQI